MYTWENGSPATDMVRMAEDGVTTSCPDRTGVFLLQQVNQLYWSCPFKIEKNIQVNALVSAYTCARVFCFWGLLNVFFVTVFLVLPLLQMFFLIGPLLGTVLWKGGFPSSGAKQPAHLKFLCVKMWLVLSFFIGTSSIYCPLKHHYKCILSVQ